MTRGAVRIGLLGCGVVGAATVRALQTHAHDLARRAGVPLEVTKIAVRAAGKHRAVELPAGVWTVDPWEVVCDPSIDVVVEVMGGVEPARGLILEAARRGKHVVTANKELLSSPGEDVIAAADREGVGLLFEAAVAGGVPIIRPMRESLSGDRVRRVLGIVNGTTNFILTRMTDTGETFSQALDVACASGYTETDPFADVEGHDAAAKLAILASLAFNKRVLAGDVEREGIARVTPRDIAEARDLGYVVKLLAVAEEQGGRVSTRVHPAMVPATHPLAAVRDVFNAIFVEADQAGELMFLGRGAGGAPTASAVVGDIVEIARGVVSGARVAPSSSPRERAATSPRELTPVRYYVVLSVVDQPGVLAAVAGAFADNDVSIASVRQEGFAEAATLALITHRTAQGRHDATIARLETLEVVKSIDSTIRVLGTPEG